MRTRYNIAKLRAVYGRAPTESPALLDLKLWRVRADVLIRKGAVAAGLELLAEVSALTLDYRRTHELNLAESDRLKLVELTTATEVRVV